MITIIVVKKGKAVLILENRREKTLAVAAPQPSLRQIIEEYRRGWMSLDSLCFIVQLY